MKKWTVMLIPQGTGPTRNLNVSTFHLWSLVGVLLCLSFSAGFLHQRQMASARQAELLRHAMVELQQDQIGPVVADAPGFEAVAAPDTELRALYEAREAAIAAELRDLYELEDEVRQLTGLPPRQVDLQPAAPSPNEGRGGGSDDVQMLSHGSGGGVMRPAQLIYGTSRPSADLILQEISLRRSSMQALVADLQVQQDRIARTPSIWPVRASVRNISSRYGHRKDPFTGRLRYHNGTDIAAPIGTPVYATARGRVSFSGRDGDYGNLIRIDHGNGTETWYAHLHRRNVRAGEQVERGQQIGAVGNTGRSTGPHLHYEVRIRGKNVNPETYLGM